VYQIYLNQTGPVSDLTPTYKIPRIRLRLTDTGVRVILTLVIDGGVKVEGKPDVPFCL